MCKDICPMMSNGENEVECTDHCAWFDTDLQECAISRINGNSKGLQDLDQSLEYISNNVSLISSALDENVSRLLASKTDV